MINIGYINNRFKSLNRNQINMLQIQQTQLVVLDIQGKLSQIVYKSDEMLANSRIMVQGAQALGIPILWVEQTPDKLGATHPSLVALRTDNGAITKKTFSAYGNPEFVKRLQTHYRPQVLLIGIETHICIYQTALDMLGAGFEVYVVADAVSSRTADNKATALAMLQSEGVKLTTTESALFALLRTSEHPQFRTVAKLIK